MLDQIDQVNTNQNTVQMLLNGSMPPLPTIENLSWQPPSQSAPVVDGTTAERLMIYANADSHDWQQYVPDVPNPDGGPLVSYWDGNPPADYTLTMRSYWVLVPGTYTQISPGSHYHKQYTTTSGIEETNAETISAELGVDVKGLSAKIAVEFSHSVTASSEQQETTTYDVDPPADGLTRVWMLWQLMDEIVALGPDGNLIANPTRHADVNWAEHNQSGAYVNYQNLHQIFPSTIIVPTQKDFPNAS